MLYKWQNHVKWRKEKKSVLVCNCQTTQIFELPLKYSGICKSLDRSYRMPKKYNDLLSDLLELKLLKKV